MKSINEMGILAIVSRMKRLGDLIQSDLKKTHEHYDIEFDNRWAAIIYILSENGKNSVMEISEIAGIAHPNTIQLLKELEKEGWVISKISSKDKRIREMHLSPKAINALPILNQYWSDIKRALNTMVDEGQTDFWSGLLEFEASLLEKPFGERVLEIKEQATHQGISATHPGKWFERKFDFKNLNATPHTVLERIKATPIKIQHRLKNVSESALIKKEGAWSIKENIGHLTDLEPIWTGRIKDILDKKEYLREIDLSNKKTEEANHNSQKLQDLITNFSSERKRLVEIAENNFSDFLKLQSIHPRLGIKMRMIDLLYFVAEHDDHHLATINYLLTKNDD